MTALSKPNDRLGYALLFALALHAIIILGVGFSAEKRSASAQRIEVTLATSSDKNTPKDADFIAQANQEGAGSLEEKALLSATESSPMQDDEEREARPIKLERQQFTELQLRLMSTTAASDFTTLNQLAEESRDLNNQGNDEITDISKEMATLRARLAKSKQELAKRGKIRRLTRLSSKRAEDAAYLHHWREKVEKIGNMHYPAEARRKGLEGELRLLVAIKADGSVKTVRILESSGHRLLDNAARRIVYLSAPYPRFSGEMAQNVDVLEIIRTWKFEQQGVSAVF